MSHPIIQSIQVGMPRQLGTPGSEDPNQTPWFSGFFKTPVEGPIEVTPTGLVGDGQADLKNHGGPDKALLCYNAGHFPFWKAELSRDDVAGGMFGENLTIDSLTEEDVCIGDTYAIGDVVVQVSQPRQPCWKLKRRWNEPKISKLVIKHSYCGWYLRVLTPGVIEAGQNYAPIERTNPEWTIRRASEAIYRKDPVEADLRELASLPELAVSWQEGLTARVKRMQN